MPTCLETTPDNRVVVTSVSLLSEQRERLTAMAASLGTTRSEVVRRAIEEFSKKVNP